MKNNQETYHQLNLIANEARNSGFDTYITHDSAIIISLTRPLSIMEVETVLFDIFEIYFSYRKVSTNQVKVTL